MAYGDFKDFPTKPAADKELLDKAFNIDRNPSYGGYQCTLASFFYKSFDKKSSGSGAQN